MEDQAFNLLIVQIGDIRKSQEETRESQKFIERCYTEQKAIIAQHELRLAEHDRRQDASEKRIEDGLKNTKLELEAKITTLETDVNKRLEPVDTLRSIFKGVAWFAAIVGGIGVAVGTLYAAVKFLT